MREFFLRLECSSGAHVYGDQLLPAFPTVCTRVQRLFRVGVRVRKSDIFVRSLGDLELMMQLLKVWAQGILSVYQLTRSDDSWGTY